MKTTTYQTAQYRACSGEVQAFGKTPVEALNALMAHLTADAPAPIVIWPYNRGDAFFTTAQEERQRALQARRESLTTDERSELEHLVEAAFDATIARTQTLQNLKS